MSKQDLAGFLSEVPRGDLMLSTVFVSSLRTIIISPSLKIDAESSPCGWSACGPLVLPPIHVSGYRIAMASPGGPGGPGGPMSPGGPFIPSRPDLPRGPLGPLSPLIPVGPVDPGRPASPSFPGGPGRPW